MKNIMKSLFKGSSKDRGIPDRIHHPENLGHNTTQGGELLIDSSLTPTSASAASSTVEDHPMAYPYQSQDFRQEEVKTMTSTGDIYVTAAFKSVHQDKAYIFMKNEYVLDDYEPNTKNDKILYGPHRVGDVFSSLKNTIFADKGIDCAFASQDGGNAYIFSGNICAKWFYAPYSPNDKIVAGPMRIAEMFPFFSGTVFENGVNAAFESTRSFEAYLFKDDQYARINYSANGHLMTITSIKQNWPCLRGTMFENGFDAAFALHIPNEAYLFKGDSYGRLKFTPGATDDELRWSGRIKESWSCLGSILPRKNANCNLVCN